MKILGIETSCDETAAAVVEDGTKILSNVIASQIDIHAKYGGVVPEIAARSHIEVMLPVVNKALVEAKTSWEDIDAIAVSYGPGLVGALLIGTLTASTLAQLKNVPLIPINHVEAHMYANFLIESKPKFPLLALIVSGSHTQLVLFTGHNNYALLGRTLDDAAGEAFDKVGRMLGLPFPGGPSVAKAAENGDINAFPLPHPQLGKDSLDFSFSGLKTAVLRSAQKAVGKDHRLSSFELPALLSKKQKNDIAASFQATVIEILTGRILASYNQYQPASVVIGGGVAANKMLREVLKAKLPIDITYAPMNLCTDNAAMIASAAFFHKKNANALKLILPNPILSM